MVVKAYFFRVTEHRDIIVSFLLAMVVVSLIYLLDEIIIQLYAFINGINLPVLLFEISIQLSGISVGFLSIYIMGISEKKRYESTFFSIKLMGREFILELNIKYLTEKLKNASVAFIKCGLVTFAWIIMNSIVQSTNALIMIYLVIYLSFLSIYLFITAIIELAFFVINIKII